MSGQRKASVVPCIDIQGGEVVQLVGGRERALVGPEPLVMLQRFEGFPEVQVIDLDAAMGKGDNDGEGGGDCVGDDDGYGRGQGRQQQQR